MRVVSLIAVISGMLVGMSAANAASKANADGPPSVAPIVRYHNAGGMSVTSASTLEIPYDTLDIDSYLTNFGTVVVHGLPTAFQFQAPIAGAYLVSASLLFTSSTAWAPTNIASLTAIDANYSTILSLVAQVTSQDGSSGAIPVMVSGSTILHLTAQQLVAVEIYQNTGSTLTVDTTQPATNVAISYIGPY